MRAPLYTAAMLIALSGVAYANENKIELGKAETECFREIEKLPPEERTDAFKACMEKKGYRHE